MLFSRLLYHGYIKEKYRKFVSDIFIREPDKVSKLMNLFIDESDMSNIMSMVQEKQWDNIENGVEDLRERIIAKLSRLQKFVLLKSTAFKVKRLMNNIGIIVQLNGDEDFKRSFSSKIAKKIERSFGGDYTIIDINGENQKHDVRQTIKGRILLSKGAVYITDSRVKLKPLLKVSQDNTLNPNQIVLKILNILAKKYKENKE